LIFKTIGAVIWRLFDAICFIAALILIDVAAFKAGVIWFYLALALTFVGLGVASEILSNKKGGD
jgi:hypothetical protein